MTCRKVNWNSIPSRHTPRMDVRTNTKRSGAAQDMTEREIFACGDVRHQLVRQITNAVGDATTAAMAAGKYIEEVEDA